MLLQKLQSRDDCCGIRTSLVSRSSWFQIIHAEWHTGITLICCRCGSIFDSSFLTQMHHVAEKMKMSRRSLALISMLMSEAMCSASKVNSQGVTLNPELEIPSSGKRKREDSESGDQMKKQKISQQFLPNAPPMFFYNYHKRHFKNIDILK